MSDAGFEDGPVCSECGSGNVREDPIRGEVICEDCGMVLSEAGIFHEITIYSGGNAPNCHKGPESLHTEISPGNRDHLGRPLSIGNQSQVFRMRKWQQRMVGYRSPHRNKHSALKEIDRICQVMEMPSTVRETGNDIYSTALEKGFTLGRPLEIISATIIYCSCRICKQPRTLNEIAGATGIDRRQLGRMQMRLARELSLRLPPIMPEDFVDRFCSNLQLSAETAGVALKILNGIGSETLFTGKDPSGLAAAAIYLATQASGQTRTQAEVEQYTGITQVTIRKRCREIVRHCGPPSPTGAFAPSSSSLCDNPLRP